MPQRGAQVHERHGSDAADPALKPETLLTRCLELAASFHPARHNYAIVLHRQNKPAAALVEIERPLGAEPRNPVFLNLRAIKFGEKF